MGYVRKDKVPQEMDLLDVDKWIFVQEASEMMGCTRQTMVRYIRKFGLKSKQINPTHNSPILVSYNAIVEFSQGSDYAARWQRDDKQSKEDKE